MSTFEDMYPYLVYSSEKNATLDESGGGGGSYTLPTASADTLGGVKVGSGLAIDSAGVLSASGGSGSGSIRVLEIEYPTPENPILNASYNDLVGMGEAGVLAVIFENNVPHILSDLYQEGGSMETTTYTANFNAIGASSYNFTSSDANQPMTML